MTNLPKGLEGASVRTGRVRFTVKSPLVVHGRRPLPALVASREHACLHVPEVASFSVRAGTEVVVEPCAGSIPDEIEAYLYGTVTALVLGQQQRFALHATTVGVAGRTVAIAGRRGAGKSSTGLALAQRGHELRGDDVLILDPGHDGVRAVTTGRPLHISRDAAAALGADLSTTVSLGPRIEKLAVPQARRSPSQLNAVVVLVPRPIEQLTARSVAGRAAFRAIHAHAYRTGLLRHLWRPELFAWASQVAASVPVHVLTRPDGSVTYAEVAERVERLACGGALLRSAGRGGRPGRSARHSASH